MTEARALGRALDQPGDVGQHGLAVLALDRPEGRRDRREGSRRPSAPPASACQQRGLARVGQADQPGVGEQLQAQLDPGLLALVPCSAKRGAWRVELAKRLLPCPPRPPWATTARWPGSSRSSRRRRRSRPGSRAAPRSPGPLPAPRAGWTLRHGVPFGAKVLAPGQRPQIPPRRVADEHHVPPVPAVPAVRPAPRHMSLPTEAHAAIAARPAFDKYLRSVVHQPQGSGVGLGCPTPPTAYSVTTIFAVADLPALPLTTKVTL